MYLHQLFSSVHHPYPRPATSAFFGSRKKTCFLPLSLPISLSTEKPPQLITRFFSPSYFSHFDFFGQKHQIFSPFFSNFQPITIYHSPIFVPITPVSTLSWLCALKWLPFQKKQKTRVWNTPYHAAMGCRLGYARQ